MFLSSLVLGFGMAPYQLVLLMVAALVAVAYFLTRRPSPRDLLSLGLGLLLTVPVFGQEPAPEPSPSPKPKAITISLDGGGLTIGVQDEVKPYLSGRATISRAITAADVAFGRGEITRTQAPELFDSFASVEVGVGYLRRFGDIRAGVLAGVTYSREDGIKSPRDPRLYTLLALGCYEPADKGRSCVGLGHRGPAGGKAATVSLQTPIKAGLYTSVEFDVPFNKIPEAVRAIGAPPSSLTAEELEKLKGRLPLAIKVGALYRFKSFGI